MEIQFIGRKPDIQTLIKVGNFEEHNVDTLEFVFDRYYKNLDLSEFTPSVEWSRLAGGADFTTDVSMTIDNEKVTVSWLLSNYFLNTAGKAACRVVFKQEEATWISDIVNLYIAKGLDISESIEREYPESYRDLWENIHQLRADVDAGRIKGEKGDKGENGSINFPIFSIDTNMNLIVKELDNPIFDLTDGMLTLEVY